ncbi:hypothetical protein HJFPF1_13245 [Paramyrothecium foliicola]|nr:hypothetical protein HJFPF1_13245 [Paramyrothecium foliicola]
MSLLFEGPSLLTAEDPLAFLIEKENIAAGRPSRPRAARRSPSPALSLPRFPQQRKRKSIELTGDEDELNPDILDEIDDNDNRLLPTGYDSCNYVRKSIRDFTGPGGMKVSEFQKVIGVNPAAYNDFMRRTGTWDDSYCDTYLNALAFFKKRHILGLPTKRPQAKRPKTTEEKEKIADLLDVSDIELLQEGTDVDVPVYDTCDEIRRKIHAFMVENDIHNGEFVEALSKEAPGDRKLNTGNLHYFLDQQGPKGGNTTALYYAAYKFFEKKRIKDHEPKTEFREEMEEIHFPSGVDRQNGPRKKYVGSADRELIVDDYARIQSVPSGVYD